MAEEYEMSKRPFTLTCPECGAALVQVKERAELCRQLAETGEIGADTAERLIAEALARAEKLKALLSSTWSTIPPGARPPD